ncbi:hypothetical protein AVEN_114150-1 [Araneus ventricosus]|uniref:Mos1 transposase HTH domain-containing protein n=1 Tax=Araneus ventricosus TaxID=182803 RepID=A0A4Y2VB62_ARAVE|nr:hypothetical protein AVEN_114150-1 [Araneus ventricosus]
MMQQVYGDAATSRARCFEWHSSFKSGRTSLEYDERSTAEIQRKWQKALVFEKWTSRIYSRNDKNTVFVCKETTLKCVHEEK